MPAVGLFAERDPVTPGRAWRVDRPGRRRGHGRRRGPPTRHHHQGGGSGRARPSPAQRRYPRAVETRRSNPRSEPVPLHSTGAGQPFLRRQRCRRCVVVRARPRSACVIPVSVPGRSTASSDPCRPVSGGRRCPASPSGTCGRRRGRAQSRSFVEAARQDGATVRRIDRRAVHRVALWRVPAVTPVPYRCRFAGSSWRD